MNLLIRINLALLATAAVACAIAAFAGWEMLADSARADAVREAGLMIDGALAIRTYTSTQIVPLLAAQMSHEFLPQSVPFYAASEHFLQLRRQHPEYSYKEATLNPTNPRDRATDWEADLIQQFRNDAHTREIIGSRDTPTGRALYLARPIRAAAECLVCHSQPADAPTTLLARYGRNNGFGWQADEVVGAQVVSVPLDAAEARARGLFHRLLGGFVLILGGTLLIVNLCIYALLVRPLRSVTQVAEELSTGQAAHARFPEFRTIELRRLVASFERLRVSLAKAMHLLER
jgi:HAMP domain-containing protein